MSSIHRKLQFNISHITGRGQIHPDEAKARKAISVPLSDVAVQVIERQRSVKRNANCMDYIFVFRRKPVYKTSNHTWREAKAKVGIENFRWHDLRHTWASWHIQRGTLLHVLQALGGWETIEMVQCLPIYRLTI